MIIIDNSAITEFDKMLRHNINKNEIALFLHNTSFKQMISSCSECVGIKNGDFDTWTTLAEKALIFDGTESEKIYEKNILSAFKAAKDDIQKLIDNSDEVYSIIESRNFVNIAARFISAIPEFTTNIYLIFGTNNAFANSGNIYLDVNLLSELPENMIDGIIAHEYHHLLREKCIVRNDNSYPLNILNWLESEAIADMCNGFMETIKLYDTLGFVNQEKILSNLNDYRSIFAMFETLITSEAGYDKLKAFLSENLNLHLIGYCMATHINQVSGSSELASCTGNSIRFINEYQEASEKNSYPYGYTFNDCFIDMINSL